MIAQRAPLEAHPPHAMISVLLIVEELTGSGECVLTEERLHFVHLQIHLEELWEFILFWILQTFWTR